MRNNCIFFFQKATVISDYNCRFIFSIKDDDCELRDKFFNLFNSDSEHSEFADLCKSPAPFFPKKYFLIVYCYFLTVFTRFSSRYSVSLSLKNADYTRKFSPMNFIYCFGLYFAMANTQKITVIFIYKKYFPFSKLMSNIYIYFR